MINILYKQANSVRKLFLTLFRRQKSLFCNYLIINRIPPPCYPEKDYAICKIVYNLLIIWKIQL